MLLNLGLDGNWQDRPFSALGPEAVQVLEKLVEKTIEPATTGHTEGGLSSSDESDAPRDVVATLKRKRQLQQYKSAKRQKQTVQISPEDAQSPLAGMPSEARSHLHWYKANQLQPFSIKVPFTSERVTEQLNGKPLELPAVYDPHLHIPRDHRPLAADGSWPSLGIQIPALPDFKHTLCFSTRQFDHTELPVVDLVANGNGRPYPSLSCICPDLDHLLSFLQHKHPMGMQGIWLSARIIFNPAPPSIPNGVTLSLVLTPYVSPAFFGLADLPASTKPLSRKQRLPIWNVFAPRVQRRRMTAALKKGSVDSGVSSEWFYSIIDPAPAYSYGDVKGKGKRPADALIKPRGLQATLLPFQSRSVAWLLGREGVQVDWASQDDAGHGVKPLPESVKQENTTIPYWEYIHFNGELAETHALFGADLSRYGVTPHEHSPSAPTNGFGMWANYITGQATAHRPTVDAEGECGFGALCEVGHE